MVRGRWSSSATTRSVGGDLITEIDGKPVSRVDSLTQALAKKRAGDNIQLTIFRGGRSFKLNVRLGEAPDAV